MNLALWTAIREYVAAEVRLALARHNATLPAHGAQDYYAAQRHVPALEEQSTRMETAVRALLQDSEINGTAS